MMTQNQSIPGKRGLVAILKDVAASVKAVASWWEEGEVLMQDNTTFLDEAVAADVVGQVARKQDADGNPVSKAELARQLGISPSTMGYLLVGIRICGLKAGDIATWQVSALLPSFHKVGIVSALDDAVVALGKGATRKQALDTAIILAADKGVGLTIPMHKGQKVKATGSRGPLTAEQTLERAITLVKNVIDMGQTANPPTPNQVTTLVGMLRSLAHSLGMGDPTTIVLTEHAEEVADATL